MDRPTAAATLQSEDLFLRNAQQLFSLPQKKVRYNPTIIMSFMQISLNGLDYYYYSRGFLSAFFLTLLSAAPPPKKVEGRTCNLFYSWVIHVSVGGGGAIHKREGCPPSV